MFVFRECKCGSTTFSDIDDEGTYRCEDCGRLAKFQYINAENRERLNEVKDND